MTRLAVIPLIVIMLTAIYTTKFEIFQQQGFWKMAHEARTDWSMLLGSLFLLIVGAGQWSIDAWLSRSRSPQFVPQHALRPLQRETSWHRPRRGACASRHLCCPLRQRRRDYSPLFIGTRLASSHLFSRRRSSEPLICGAKVLILLCTPGCCDRAFCIALLFTTISHQGVPK